MSEYLESGKKLEGFRVLLCRAKKATPQPIADDLELIRQFLAKAGTTK
jgi:hypothetical protein